MSSEDEFERLIDNLGQCLRQARALKLQHAVHLLNMAVMEVSDRSIDHPSKPTALTKGPLRPVVRREI
jgi:hypothetical protein